MYDILELFINIFVLELNIYIYNVFNKNIY